MKRFGFLAFGAVDRRRRRPGRARLRLAAAVGGLRRAAPARAGAGHGGDGRGASVRMTVLKAEEECLARPAGRAARSRLPPRAALGARGLKPDGARRSRLPPRPRRAGCSIPARARGADDAAVLCRAPRRDLPGLLGPRRAPPRRGGRPGPPRRRAPDAPRGAPLLVALARNEDVLRRDVLDKSLGGLEGKSVLAVARPRRPDRLRLAPARRRPARAHRALRRRAAGVARRAVPARGPLAARCRPAADRDVHRRLRAAARRDRARPRRDLSDGPAGVGDGAAQVRLRRQRVARSQDAAVADPHVRGDARDGPACPTRRRAASTTA